MFIVTGRPCQSGKKLCRKVWSVRRQKASGCVQRAPASRRRSAGDGRGDEDAGVQPVEIGEALVDVRRCGKFRIVEIAVDILQHQRIGVDEDAALIFGQLPQPQLEEIVERRVEVRLFALGEGGSAVNSRSRACAALKASERGRRSTARPPAAEVIKRRPSIVPSTPPV